MKKISLYISVIMAVSFPTFAQLCKPGIITPSHSKDQYVDNNDGTITDIANQLMWSRCSLGQDFLDNECGNSIPMSSSSWQEALNAVASFNSENESAYQDWRLPNIKELGSLVERSCSAPAIDLTLFPSTASAPYWSNTFDSLDIYLKSGIDGLIINFEDGFEFIDVNDDIFIRLVRDIPTQ